MNTITSNSVRLFFAAWPSAAVQEALHGVAERVQLECGGRAVAQRNIHATLAFLGNVPRDRLADIQAVAAGAGGAPCDLSIDRLHYWRHNRVLWAGVERCPSTLLGLVGRLETGLRKAGFSLDDRPYALHITLLRNARRAPAAGAIAAVSWSIEDFALIESVARAGVRVYEVVRRWPMKG